MYINIKWGLGSVFFIYFFAQVSGYIRISHVSTNNLHLDSLQIIRGKTKYNGTDALHIDHNDQLEELRLKSLKGKVQYRYLY